MHNLRDYVQTYDEALPREFCDQIIAGFESLPDCQVQNGAGIRAGLEQSAWVEMDLGRLAGEAFLKAFNAVIHKYYGIYREHCRLPVPFPPPMKLDQLIMKRYRAGNNERFQVHYDSLHQHCNRYLVMLWYLNDVAEGGATRFVDLDLEVQPSVGRLLIFPPYWMYQHVALPPVSEDKYILSTYLLY